METENLENLLRIHRGVAEDLRHTANVIWRFSIAIVTVQGGALGLAAQLGSQSVRGAGILAVGFFLSVCFSFMLFRQALERRGFVTRIQAVEDEIRRTHANFFKKIPNPLPWFKSKVLGGILLAESASFFACYLVLFFLRLWNHFEVVYPVPGGVAPNSFTWASTLAALLSFFSGAVVAIFTEPLRAWFFRPKIALMFRNDRMCVRETPATLIGKNDAGETVNSSPSRMLSIRFLVENTSKFRAQACQAFLQKVERKAEDNNFTVEFEDMIPLKWSYGLCEPVVLPAKTGRYCDLLGAADGDPNLTVACCGDQPQILREIFAQNGVYRFTALVAADNVTPATIRICANWQNTWRIEHVWQD